MNIYIVENNKFYISETPPPIKRTQKSFLDRLRIFSYFKSLEDKYNFDISLLQKIETAIKNKMDYAGPRTDNYSHLQKEELFQILKEKAAGIDQSYHQAHWLTKLIFRITGRGQRIHRAFLRIKYLVAPPKVFPLLPLTLTMEIVKHLPLSTVAKMERINRDGRTKMQVAWISEAKIYGYLGDDVAKAKKYLENLFKSIESIFAYGLTYENSKKLSVFKKMNGRELDREGTLRNFRYITAKEMFEYFDYESLKYIYPLLNHINTNVSKQQPKETIPGLAAPMLNQAIDAGNEEFVKFILKQGGRINKKESGENLCALFSKKNPPKILKVVFLLKNFDVDPNVCGSNGYPLSSAIQQCLTNQYHDGIELISTTLLHHGANPNLRGIDGRTPLHIAIQTGLANAANTKIREHIVELLLENHANPDIRDAEGHTPLYYARQYNQSGIMALLQAKDASL